MLAFDSLNSHKIRNHPNFPGIDLGVLDAFNDGDFKDFIKKENGGFYFSKSLIIYGLSQHYSLIDMNIMLHSLYDGIIEGYQCFACDIFGNQFLLNAQGVSVLNVESGDVEFLAKSFCDWVKVIKADTDYYTGESLLISWEKENRTLEANELLAAKNPFVLGGEYRTENLYALEIERLFAYNATIALQINNLPDGTRVDLEIID